MIIIRTEKKKTESNEINFIKFKDTYSFKINLRNIVFVVNNGIIFDFGFFYFKKNYI